MFTIVIVASKNSRTTVSPSTGTHYMKMLGWVRGPNKRQQERSHSKRDTTETGAESVIGLF